jgi:phage terminase large subunit-like protein
MIQSIGYEQSMAQKFALMPDSDKLLAEMTPEEQRTLYYSWEWNARPKQLLPIQEQDWSTFILLCGRGFGKTRSGVQWVDYMAKANPGCFIAIVGPTTQSVNRTLVEGETGLLTVCEPGTIKYERTKAQVRWKNGSIGQLLTAEKPDRIRGLNFHYALADEVVAWKNPEVWDMLQLALRIGNDPKTLVTTTPKPTELILKLIGGEENVKYVNSQLRWESKNGRTKVVRGVTFENTALSPEAFENYKDLYLDTALGDQELFAKLLVDVQGALFKRRWFQHYNFYTSGEILLTEPKPEPDYIKTVVAVDPATTATSKSDQTGIAVVSKGVDGRYYVRHSSGHQLSPNKWAEEVVKVYKKYKADKIVCEVNQGGDMVENTMRMVTSYDSIAENGSTTRKSIDGFTLPIEKIHAKKGKLLRAEEIALLYEQKRVWHMHEFAELESQMCVFRGEPNGSDDLVDSLVYAFKELTGERLIEYTEPMVIGEGLISNKTIW